MATYPAISLPTIYAANMTEQQRARYYAELSVVQKDEVLGVLLAVFLGTFGAHHFYMRRNGLGILYCFLSVTGFSTVAGFVEAFFMPERIRRYNAMQAAAIANSLGIYYGSKGATMPIGAVPAFLTPSNVPVSGTAVVVAPSAPLSVPDTTLSNHAAPTVCQSCSAPISPGVNFCSVCGTAVHAWA